MSGVDEHDCHEHTDGPTRAMRRHVARAPITLYATNQGRVEVRVTPNWSLWTEHGSSGRAALVDAGQALIADGWRSGHAGRAFPEFA